MSYRNKICPVCEINKIKNFYATQCGKCYQKSKSGKDNPNYKGREICKQCGGKKDRHNKTNLCGKCYRIKYVKGLPKCIGCGENLSRYDSLKKGFGYCQKCYKGSKTRRWNPNLPQEFREQGRSINPECYKWRNEIFKRDNYTCQFCEDNSGNNLNAHHLDSFAIAENLRTNINNGITLCITCHKGFHGLYGYFNNTKSQFLEWII